MRMSLQSRWALLVSAVFHVAVVFAFFTPKEVGRSVPFLVYPVRERTIEVQLAQVNIAPTTQPKDATITSAPVAASPVASAAEGRLEQFTEIYAESSEQYFPPAELDHRPIVIDPPDLGVINISPTTEGEAVLRFFLDENGVVLKMEVEQSSLPEMMMEQLKLQRDQLRFVPGYKNGINVKSVIRYKILLEKDPIVTIVSESK